MIAATGNRVAVSSTAADLQPCAGLTPVPRLPALAYRAERHRCSDAGPATFGSGLYQKLAPELQQPLTHAC